MNSERQSTRKTRHRIWLGVGIVLGSLVLFLFTQCSVLPWLDTRRMNSVAFDIVHAIRPGMTSHEALRELDRIGVEHSPLVLDSRYEDFQPSEVGVIYSMIRSKPTWELVKRDIQIHVYFDGGHKVTRVLQRDVLTGL